MTKGWTILLSIGKCADLFNALLSYCSSCVVRYLLTNHQVEIAELFVKIAPQKFRLKYQGARDVILRKSIFSTRSPPRYFSLNISTLPPTARIAEHFYLICWNVSYNVTERIFPILEMDIFLTSPPSACNAEMFWNVIEHKISTSVFSEFTFQPSRRRKGKRKTGGEGEKEKRKYPRWYIFFCHWNIHWLFSIYYEEQARAARKLFWL